jgi:hypothetical protein
MDSDLQNDPADIPRLVDALHDADAAGRLARASAGHLAEARLLTGRECHSENWIHTREGGAATSAMLPYAPAGESA